MEEKPHCNICHTDIDTINNIEEHSSTPIHLLRKSNLEKILGIIRTSKEYRYTDSVTSSWKKVMVVDH